MRGLVSEVGVDDLRTRLRLRAHVLQTRDVIEWASNQRESAVVVGFSDNKVARITSVRISSSVLVVEHIGDNVGHSGVV